jgi:hypothetical protein
MPELGTACTRTKMETSSSYARDYCLSHVIETYDLNRTFNAESAVLEVHGSPVGMCRVYLLS